MTTHDLPHPSRAPAAWRGQEGLEVLSVICPDGVDPGDTLYIQTPVCGRGGTRHARLHRSAVCRAQPRPLPLLPLCCLPLSAYRQHVARSY
jgi:hypothetical protein